MSAGSVAKIAVPVAKQVVKKAEPFLERALTWLKESPGINNFGFSGQSLAHKTKAGTIFDSLVKNEYEPALRRETVRLVQEKVPILEAKKQATKTVKAEYFGKKGEIKDLIYHAAAKEKGTDHANILADYMDSYFFETGTLPYRQRIRQAQLKTKGLGKYTEKVEGEEIGEVEYDPEKWKGVISSTSKIKPIEPWEAGIRKWAGVAFLSRLAIKHFFQPANLMLDFGIKNTFKGFLEHLRTPKEKRLQDMGILMATSDELVNDARKIAAGETTWIDRYLHSPGFTQQRKHYLSAAGYTGKSAVLEAAGDLVRNPANKVARSQLELLGVDTNDLLKRGGKLEQKEIENAMFRAAQESMFLQTGRTIPPGWNRTPLTRMMFQYKPYSFREILLTKDALKRAWNTDPANFIRTVAKISTIFPAAGAMMKAAEELATLKMLNKDEDKDSILGDYLETLAYAGSLGAAHTTLQAARYGRLLDYAAGPVPSSAFEHIQDIMQIGTPFMSEYKKTTSGEVSKKAAVRATKKLVRRVPIVGPMAMNILKSREKIGRASCRERV